jgi:hypothetical protein
MYLKEPKTFLSQERILVTPEFIQKNNLRLREQNEYSKKFDEILSEGNIFEFRDSILVSLLTFETAKPFLQDGYVSDVESGVKNWECITNIEECTQEFLDYMNFAWGKAEDQRGLYASRSIDKLSIWLWAMNREDLVNIIKDDDLYNPYGAPALIAVCNEMGIEVPSSLIEFSKRKCGEDYE